MACTLEVDGVGAVTGLATDLSARGLWITVETPLEVGVLVDARFRLPRTGRELSVVAEVARVDADEGGAFGMGLRFRCVSPSDRIELDTVLSGLPPRLPTVEALSLEEEVEEILDDADDVVIEGRITSESGLFAIVVDDPDGDDFAMLRDDELERFVG
jgi:hypothetical protein